MFVQFGGFRAPMRVAFCAALAYRAVLALRSRRPQFLERYLAFSALVSQASSDELEPLVRFFPAIEPLAFISHLLSSSGRLILSD